jgi:beta-N-acetylhexosaminidase
MKFIKHFLFVFSIVIIALLVSAKKRTGGAPSHSKNLPASEKWAEEQLQKLNLDEKIAQFFMVAAYSGQGEKHLAEIQRLITDHKIGGVIFFQGERKDLASAIEQFQKSSKVPLLIGMDAEWGVQMRLSGEQRFPYAYTLGAANDPELSERVAAMMAQECRELGIHMNFSPVADVNSDPDNPVIGFRSFGENPKLVSDHVRAFVRGFESNGIMATLKHFPGHGNTDKDSHLELPTVSQSLKTLEAIDLYPFSEGLREGASSVMIGHLNVPAMDDSGTPSSLSSKIIKDYLQKKMGFQGLVISDALNMKAVADRYGKTETVVKAFEAGCDILLFPESVADAIKAIRSKVDKGQISIQEINERCLKVLKAKQKYVVSPSDYKKYTFEEQQWARHETYEKALTVLKNKEELLPLKELNTSTARISIGENTHAFRDAVSDFADLDHYHYDDPAAAQSEFVSKADKYKRIIVAFHANTVRSRNSHGFGNNWDDFLNSLPVQSEIITVFFGNPQGLFAAKTDKADAIIVAYENHPSAQSRVAQLIFGAAKSSGKLPMSIKNTFDRGEGIELPWGGRLKFSQPEEFGISSSSFDEVDKIAINGVKKGAYPGCQIVLAYKGSIIYRKSFGTKMYEDTVKVTNDDLYDIASVTKIAASTIGLMSLQSKGDFSLDKQLKDYIQLKDSKYASINLRDMMAHQAGLTAWIPFYKRTLNAGNPDQRFYSDKKTAQNSLRVADDLWISSDYTDSIYQQIMRTPLAKKTYVYSDLGYYFVKKIIEKQSSKSLDEFLIQELYGPMGLRSLRYNPIDHFSKARIAPTERDMAFRKQLIHGYVHDPGAAMLGGVGGHAGLFSNATDLASLMQMLLNKGMYGGKRYIKEQVVDEYTKAQFAGNRRGAGFDRPTASGGGTCHSKASQKSYGHSGFTGTLAWADPEHQINYVFLSNRVCPDQENWKLRDMNIRTEIQRVFYEALTGSK